VSGLDPALDPAALAYRLSVGQERFAPVLKPSASMPSLLDRPGKVGEMQIQTAAFTLRPDGSNAASVLQEIERLIPGAIEGSARSLLASCQHTRSPGQHGTSYIGAFTQEWGERKRLN